ncbi:hypothetical protein [Nocardioides sp.]|uniref:hypothetical protein n=1 Tax=Nocardioides sp. TaxID=35761 RepID=UPI002C88BA42|nr:hypothetical protein [Nocardioides sp.]HSX68165.1 hypothetical protein [Nocardioides sp.]
MLKFLLVVVAIALVVYGCVMLVDRQLNGTKRPGPFRPPRPGRGSTPQRPLGPDDDPDFLWKLNQRNRRKPPKSDDS